MDGGLFLSRGRREVDKGFNHNTSPAVLFSPFPLAAGFVTTLLLIKVEGTQSVVTNL